MEARGSSLAGRRAIAIAGVAALCIAAALAVLLTRSSSSPPRAGGLSHTPPAAPPSPASAVATAILPASARASFTALTATLAGQAGIAIAPLGEGPIQTLGAPQDGHAWSTMKVPVIVTLLHGEEERGVLPSTQTRANATRALEQSDNAAAEALFSELKAVQGGLVPASEAVERTLRGAGDHTTSINTAPNARGFTTWGQSIWSNSGAVTFYRALADGCLMSPGDTGSILELMRQVIPAQRWGAGEAGYERSLPLAFKGGWGPESTGGYLVRQTAIVGSGQRGYVMSMIALPRSGSFADGTSILSTIAGWVRRHAALAAGPPLKGCPGSAGGPS
jgi:hypothetical protein